MKPRNPKLAKWHTPHSGAQPLLRTRTAAQAQDSARRSASMFFPGFYRIFPTFYYIYAETEQNDHNLLCFAAIAHASSCVRRTHALSLISPHLREQTNAAKPWENFISYFARIYCIYVIFAFLCIIYTKKQHKHRVRTAFHIHSVLCILHEACT